MESWEIRLNDTAHQALQNSRCLPRHPSIDAGLSVAYEHCRKIAQNKSKTFYTASRLIGTEKRAAIWALYAFCRSVDDLVDESSADSTEYLAQWQLYTLHGLAPLHNPTALAWCRTLMEYHIPKQYAIQLIEGVSRDIHQHRYESFADLTTYCYGVASTVGLMAMHIIGFSGKEAIPYAVKLGVALQMTNILRDVGEDWQRGRLYLPLDELAEFNLGEQDMAEGIVDDRWRNFMRFQIERTRRLYAESMPGIAMLNPEGRFAIAAAAQLYSAILGDIEIHDYNVFDRRAHVSKWGKLRRLPSIWLRVKGIYPSHKLS